MNIQRIAYYLSHPHKLLDAVKRKMLHKRIRSSYNYESYELDQIQKFRAIGLDYASSKNVLKNIYAENPDLMVKMQSCHHNLFAALIEHDPKRILEIGTHTGAGSALLSKLFPSADIETIDLPDDHPVFDQGAFSIYGRNSNPLRLEFLEKRNLLLGKCPNVTFSQMDSTALTIRTDKSYDFIWVDANHEFPYVATDIANGIRLLAATGIMGCDDVRTENSDTMSTLRQFADAGLIDYTLIHKRTELPDNLDLVGKYIAVVRKK